MSAHPLDENIVSIFTPDNKAITFKLMLDVCHCSEATLRRHIKQIGMLVSYNFNSRFYTLSSAASFNEHGIWDYRGILFSTYGSLTRTVKAFIDSSKQGYTPAELTSILHVRVNDLLRAGTNKGDFGRERVGRHYVYYSSVHAVFTAQHQKRQLSVVSVELKNDTAIALQDNDTVIAILVEIILSGKLGEQDLQESLKNGSNPASLADIHAVITHFGLKKTMRR